MRIVFENGYPPVGIITLHFSCIAKSGQKLHLRNVGRKHVEMAHLRKVCMVWRVGKCSSRRFSCRWCFCAPSEGGMKMRGNGSPSEGVHGVACGKMQQQAVLVAVVFLLTFGRWDENAGKWLTFGRCAWCGGRGNAAAGGSRGGGAFAHLRKVGRKCVEMAHLRKVCMVWRVGKRSSRRLSCRWCFCAPSEGGTKTRGNGSPLEGGHGSSEGG